VANKYTDAVHKMILPGKGRDRVTTKAVLTAMAWHTDNKAGTFWGTHNTFAREANCSRDAVRENVPKLVELGLITAIGQKPTRYGPCHFYRMNLDAILKLSDRAAETPSEDGDEDNDRGGSDAGEPPKSLEPPYGDPTQGVEPSPPGVLATPHQGVEPSDQGAEPPENSSLNSSFWNSSLNSSIKSKSTEHDDSIDSISQKQTSGQSQTPDPNHDMPEPIESVQPPPPVHPASPPNVSAAPRKSSKPDKPVCKRLLCGGPLKPNGECKKCGAEPNVPVAAPQRPKNEYGEEVEGLPHHFLSRDREETCQNPGCDVTRLESMYDKSSKYCYGE
jgi:hypothetical protein